MSLFGWLKDAFGGKPPELEPEAELPAEEALLRNLLGARRRSVRRRQRVAIGDREFWAAVQRLPRRRAASAPPSIS